jgi:tryptophan-rich sensory protein
MSDWMAAGAFALANFAAASSGAFLRPGAWYEGLRKPVWVPPNWAFPVVWTALFALNAWAGWLVWQKAGWGPEIAVYGISLAINAAWSGVFFGLKRLDWGMANVLALWASIVAVAFMFAPVSPLAAALQAPYLLWVSIAAALNARMWQLNGARGERVGSQPAI